MLGEKYVYKLTESGFVFDKKETGGLEKSFSDFLKNFTENRESQIALLHKPFRYVGLDTNTEGYSRYFTHWNEEKINTDWYFWEDTYFFEGTKYIDNYEFFSIWKQENDTISKYAGSTAEFLILKHKNFFYN